MTFIGIELIDFVEINLRGRKREEKEEASPGPAACIVWFGNADARSADCSMVSICQVDLMSHQEQEMLESHCSLLL